jgi:site-specific DNA-methyltransferase (adenine-specific)
MQLNVIYNEECIEGMNRIDDHSIDMILCDLPYGTTACKWDVIIPFDLLWKQYKRIIKKDGAIVLTGSEPFSSLLRTSNLPMYRYDWIWNKVIPSGMTYARFQPMRQHENIMIFSIDKCVYNPQMIKRDKPIKSGGQKNLNSESTTIDQYKVHGFKRTYEYKNPTTIIEFMKIRKGSLHRTQKPVALFEYLIRTYTNENEIVLDNCIGSGTTAIAALNTNRSYIGYELDAHYYQVAVERIQEHATK